jgi:Fe-S cluster biogenesis protein NfuA/nitrite reductase/ring-hydroxylating ferredoxin subunit
MTAGRVVELQLDPSAPALDSEALVERVQQLAARLESIDDAEGRAIANALLAALLDLYGAGLQRIMEALAGGGPELEAVRDALVDDGVVGSLLLIHGLYPVSLEDRVLEALESVRPYMESHGGNVELVAIEAGVARLRLQGSCNGCPSSASTMELALRQALDEHAPDLEGLEVEGVVEPPARAPHLEGGRLPLVGASSPAGPSWIPVAGAEALPGGAMSSHTVAGMRVLLANVGGTLLAYRDGCAGCGAPLVGGELDGGLLACPACGRRFELPLAGRSVDGEGLQLVPLPLLAGDGGVRVAVGG